jgi:uncharacterized protein YndB with AHSA1/START domain
MQIESGRYSFITIWRVAAAREDVWRIISDSERWSEWWPGVLRVELLTDGDERGVGAVHRSTWRSALPYSLTFDSETVRIDDGRLIEIRAFGELDGTGKWTLEDEPYGVTRIRYDWNVRSTKRWMNLMAPIAKPFFSWNHNVIMRRGGKGLADKLGARLLTNE